MSREFGDSYGGFFHDKIQYASEDALKGRDQLTKMFGAFLTKLCPIAYAISTSEACDSGPDYPILETIKHIDGLKDELEKIHRMVKVYEDVASESVRKALENAQEPVERARK